MNQFDVKRLRDLCKTMRAHRAQLGADRRSLCLRQGKHAVEVEEYATKVNGFWIVPHPMPSEAPPSMRRTSRLWYVIEPATGYAVGPPLHREVAEEYAHRLSRRLVLRGGCGFEDALAELEALKAGRIAAEEAAEREEWERRNDGCDNNDVGPREGFYQ